MKTSALVFLSLSDVHLIACLLAFKGQSGYRSKNPIYFLNWGIDEGELINHGNFDNVLTMVYALLKPSVCNISSFFFFFNNHV